MVEKSDYIFIFCILSYSLFEILEGVMKRFEENRNLILCGYIVVFLAF